MSACGASASAPAHRDGAGDTTPSSAVTTAPPVAAGDGTGGSGGGGVHGTGGSGDSTATSDGAAATTAPRGAASAAPAGAAGAGGARPVALPAPGRYTYRVTGTASSAFGDQKIDDRSELTVERLTATRERMTQHNQDGSNTQVLVARTTGLFLAEMSMAGQGFTETFHPDGDAMLIGAHPVTGQSWSWRMHSDDGDYTLRATMTVADAATHATVGGRSVPAVRVTSVLEISGKSMSMQIHQDDLATTDATIVREKAVGDGTAYGVKFHSDTVRRLLSTP